MTLASIALVVLAALIHATWNLLAKRAAAVGPAFVLASNLVSCVSYAPWVLWLLPRGAVALSWPVLGPRQRRHPSRLLARPPARLPGRRLLGRLPSRPRLRPDALEPRRGAP